MKSADDARTYAMPSVRAAFSLGELGETVASWLRRRTRIPAAYVPWSRRLILLGPLVAATLVVVIAFVDAPVRAWASTLPRWLIDVFERITDFGRSGWILIPIGLLWLMTWGVATRTFDRMSRAVLALVMVRLGFVFVGVGLPSLIATIVKRWIGRVRPSDLGPFAFEPFSWRSEFASLPSGHSTTAFAALVAIGFVFPRAGPALWVYALLIATSRVVVGAHYTSDVIAGAATGAIGAFLLCDWMARRRLAFYFSSSGRVRAMPVPSLRRLKRVAATVTTS